MRPLKERIYCMEDTKKAVKPTDPLDELVDFKAFKDDGKYKDDLVFTVAGKLWQIKRGVRVQIPRYVYNVIMESEEQAQAAADYSEKKEQEYKNSRRNFE
jgi:hypothetical protein